MTLLKTAFISALILSLSWLAGCQSMTTQTSPSLYEQLGERSGIQQVVEDLLFKIVDDERINEDFKGIDVQDFVTNLTDQLCELSGGPCTYSGRDMRESHEEMNVTDTEFNALAELLILAMEDNNIPTPAQNELIKRLVPLYPEIRNL